MTSVNTLQELFVDQLRDIYSAETQLVTALPKMAAAAHNEELRKAFQHHLAETQEHVRRLENIFGHLSESPLGETCKAMQGLIREAEDHLAQSYGDPNLKDACLITCAQRVEHYEIAAYGTVAIFAKHLGLPEAKSLLEKTLSEEGAADKLLTKLAEGSWFTTGINKKAESA